jgi:hypothetical protein
LEASHAAVECCPDPDGSGGQSDEVVRAAGVFGLVAVAVVHFSDIVPTMEQTPWLGVAFSLLSAASVTLASQFLERSSRRRWLGVAAVNASTILGTSSPVPSRRRLIADVGSWSDNLGITALFIEALMV